MNDIYNYNLKDVKKDIVIGTIECNKRGLIQTGKPVFRIICIVSLIKQ